MIVIGLVSLGVEVIVGGLIYIYGVLWGCVLVGVVGKDGVWIFCFWLDVEFVLINGFYKIVEDFDIGFCNELV